MSEKGTSVVILGGGQAGGMVARGLLSGGFQGTITLVCSEPYAPYERPPLSKGILASEERHACPPSSIIRCPERISSDRLTLKLARHATAIDRKEHLVWLDDKEALFYDRLVIATGGSPRRVAIPGSRCSGIHYLRTFDDAMQLKDRLAKAETVLIVGGGWIGLEVAATARRLGKRVALIEMDSQLCRRTLPEPVSSFLADHHRNRGVYIRFGATVTEFVADKEGQVCAAILSDGTRLAADVVLAGIGIEPNTAVARAAGLNVGSGILVDADGRTNDPSIYAAGDVAERNCEWYGRPVRLESWQSANNQADIVACSILGRARPSLGPPWFWSDQYDLNIQLLGVPLHGEQVINHELAADGMLAIYLRADRICGAMSINRARDLRLVAQAMAQGIRISKDKLQHPDLPLRLSEKLIFLKK